MYFINPLTDVWYIVPTKYITSSNIIDAREMTWFPGCRYNAICICNLFFCRLSNSPRPKFQPYPNGMSLYGNWQFILLICALVFHGNITRWAMGWGLNNWFALINLEISSFWSAATSLCWDYAGITVSSPLFTWWIRHVGPALFRVTLITWPIIPCIEHNDYNYLSLFRAWHNNYETLKYHAPLLFTLNQFKIVGRVFGTTTVYTRLHICRNNFSCTNFDATGTGHAFNEPRRYNQLTFWHLVLPEEDCVPIYYVNDISPTPPPILHHILSVADGQSHNTT